MEQSSEALYLIKAVCDQRLHLDAELNGLVNMVVALVTPLNLLPKRGALRSLQLQRRQHRTLDEVLTGLRELDALASKVSGMGPMMRHMNIMEHSQQFVTLRHWLQQFMSVLSEADSIYPDPIYSC
jgi:hypothetical protein